tara:strand:- start:4202 stop:4390 length:189 start_codon:yes stop_codon:yes gene_type:complete
MDNVIDLKEYKDRLLLKEIAEMRRELELIMASWPEDLGNGYFLSIEEMDRIERIWAEEKSKE